MTLRDRWQDRQTRKAAKHMSAMWNASLVGKPHWASAARLLAVQWIQVQELFPFYLEARRAEHADEAAEVRAAARAAIESAIELAGEIELPAVGAAIESLQRIAAALDGKGRLSEADFEAVTEFTREAYELVAV